MRASNIFFLVGSAAIGAHATIVEEFFNDDCSGTRDISNDMGIWFDDSSFAIDDQTKCLWVQYADEVYAYDGELDSSSDRCIGTLLGTLPAGNPKPDEFVAGRRVTCITLETPR